jgi:SAM-dependent methyltransferase
VRRGRAEETAVHEWADPTPGSPSWGDHRGRYHFGAGFVRGRYVLDIACGSGLGADILLDTGAKGVVGVDTAPEALARTRERRPRGASLCRADGARLPFRDGSFGAVTSFETLEHVREPDRLLDELHRVLGPDGVLVLSTPNALHTKPIDGTPRNPFHVREFTPTELENILTARFRQVELLGQAPHAHYEACPYWVLPEHLPKGASGRARVVSWKMQSRLPAAVREGLARALHGRSFYPGEHDFVFSESAVGSGHVLVAVCRP